MKWSLSPRVRSSPRPANGSAERRGFKPAVECLEVREVPAAFTPGNLVVMRIGTGAGALSSAALPGFLEEYRIDGTGIQWGNSAIPLATTDGLRDRRITFAGNAIGEGSLQRSADGQFLTVVGYAADLGTSNVAGTASAANNRIVGVVGLDGLMDTTTSISDTFSGAAVRSVVTDDGQQFWVSGSANGIRLINFGPGNITGPVLNNPGSVQTLNAIRTGPLNNPTDRLFATSDASSFLRMNQVGGNAMPQAVSTANQLPGSDMQSIASNQLFGFAFLDRDSATSAPGMGGLDTLYIADKAAGVRKYFFDANTDVWRNTGSPFTGGLDGFEGLAAVRNGNNAEIYVTNVRSQGHNNALFKIVDTNPFSNQIPSNAVMTKLADAGDNKVFRGLAWVPQEITNPIAPTAPRVISITRTDPSPTNAAQVHYYVEFSESVRTPDGSANGAINVDANDFELITTGTGPNPLTGASITGSVTQISPRIFEVTVNTGTGDGTIQLRLTDNGTIRDYGGNPLVGMNNIPDGSFDGEVYIIDKTPPEVLSIERKDPSPTTSDSIRYNVRFTEPVLGVDSADFQVTLINGNLVASTFVTVAGSGEGYEVTVTTFSGTGTLRLDVIDNDSIRDLAGNLLGGFGSNNGNFITGQEYLIDRSPPRVQTITRLDANPTAATILKYRVKFDEAVNGVGIDDFVITSTTVSPAIINVALVPGSVGDIYTVTITSGTGSGTVRLDVFDNDSIVDLVGFRLGGGGTSNGNFTSGQLYTIDHTPPKVLSIDRADATNPTTAAQVNFTVKFDDNVVGVDTTDFKVVPTGTLNTATVASVTPVSGNTYTVTVNTGLGAGTLALKLDDNDTITDAAGNPLGDVGNNNGDFTGQAYTVDREIPAVVSLKRLDPSPTALTTVRYEVKFNKPVIGVDATDFNLVFNNLIGAAIGPVAGGDDTWTVEVNTGTGLGTLQLNLVDDDSIKDTTGLGLALGDAGAGNGNFTGEIYNVDRTTPSVVSINITGAPAGNAAVVNYEVKFDEPVKGVDAADFSLMVVAGTPTGAAIGQVTGTGDTWTVAVSTGTGEGTVRLDLVDNNSITDLAGNVLGGAGVQNFTGPNFTLDRRMPFVQSITRNDASPTNAATVQYTVQFSENVTGVDASDFTLTALGGLTGASIQPVVGGGGATYTVTVSTGAGSGTLRLNLADDDTIRDGFNNPPGGPGAGNGNFTTGEVYTIDRTPPAVQAIRLLNVNPTDLALVTFRVDFTEAVSGVDLTDFTLTSTGVSGASLVSTNGTGSAYDVVVQTGAGNGTVKINLVDNDSIQDVLNAPLGGVGAGNGSFSTGPAYSVDKTPKVPPPVIPTEFVPKALTDLLQRPADAGSVAQWNAVLAGGGTRQDVALGIMNSDEFRSLLVQRLARRYLGRQLPARQLPFLVGVLRRFGSLEATVIEILARNGHSFQAAARRVLTRRFRISLIADIFQQYLRRNPTGPEVDQMLAAMYSGEPVRRALYGDGLRNGVRHEQLIADVLARPEYAR